MLSRYALAFDTPHAWNPRLRKAALHTVGKEEKGGGCEGLGGWAVSDLSDLKL